MKQALPSVLLCLLAVLWRPASAGLLSVLDMPEHDGVSRVCQLATGDALSQAVAAGTPLVVRVVKDAAKKECSAEDFVEVAAQLLEAHGVKFCDVPESAFKESNPSETVAVGNVYLHRNGRRTAYYGRKSASALISWIHKMKYRKMSVINGKVDKAAFDQVLHLKIVGFFINGTTDYAMFQEACAVKSGASECYAVFDRNVAKHMKLTTVGQIAIYSPFSKLPIVLAKNPANVDDILAFVTEHDHVSLVKVDEHNIHDPKLEDPTRVNVLAVAEQSTPLGGYLLRLLYKTLKNVTNTTSVTAVPFQVLWIDPSVLPTAYRASSSCKLCMMEQFGQQTEPPYLGTYNAVTGQGIWFDMKLLNTTGGKAVDEENVQKLLDWVAGLATPGSTQGKSEASWQFTELPASQIVPEGSNVVLRCSVQKAVGDCLWLKDGRNIGFNLARLPHLSWAGDHASGDCSLAISGVQSGRDDGSWVCEMTGDAQHPTITSPPAVLVVSGELFLP
ncbi:unnamed protein product, partial [Ixodes hexagonus]